MTLNMVNGYGDDSGDDDYDDYDIDNDSEKSGGLNSSAPTYISDSCEGIICLRLLERGE